MTTNSETPRIVISGNGTRGPFTLSVGGSPITYAATSEWVFKRYGTDDALDATLVYATDYTLSAASVETGDAAATVTLSGAQEVLASGESLLGERVTVKSSSFALASTGGVFEAAVDKQIRILQELVASIDRRVSTHPLFSGDAALPIAEAGKFIGWNADADGFTNLDTTAAGVSDAMAPFLASDTVFDAFNRDTVEGLAGDGVTDDLPVLQAKIDAVSAAGGGELTLSAFATYKLSGRLLIKSKVVLDGRWAKLKFTNATDGITVYTGGFVRRVRPSSTSIGSFTGPLFKVDDADGYVRTDAEAFYPTGGEYVFGDGPGAGASAAGTGLHVVSTTATGISTLNIRFCKFNNFSKGAHIKASGSGWVNGNYLNFLSFFGCVNHIYLEGAATDGNDFTGYRIQPNTDVAIANRAIYCESDYNTFIGQTWDWDSSGSALAHEFTSATGDTNIVLDATLPLQYIDGAALVQRTQYSVLSAGRDGLDDTSAQNIFASTEDELQLSGSTLYGVDAYIVITRTAGTTSHQVKWLFGGTCGFNDCLIQCVASNPSGIALSTPQVRSITAKAAVAITAANTSATERVEIRLHGVIRNSTAGTLIPQIQYDVAPGGVPTFQKDSYFRIWPLGPSALKSAGAWS